MRLLPTVRNKVLDPDALPAFFEEGQDQDPNPLRREVWHQLYLAEQARAAAGLTPWYKTYTSVAKALLTLARINSLAAPEYDNTFESAALRLYYPDLDKMSSVSRGLYEALRAWRDSTPAHLR